MPHTKSAKKRVLTNEANRLRNVARRSDIKTACRKVKDALAQKDTKEAVVLLKAAESKISRACGKGLLKKNAAARKVSGLAKKVALATSSKEGK
jgi:small subunit ribosomal protein S20